LKKETIMQRRNIALVATIVLCAASWSAKSAENVSPIVGTWLLTAYSEVYLDNGETIRRFGDHPTGYIQYSPGGHLVVFVTTGEPKRPATLNYSDADRADVYRGIIAGYTATYTIDGNKAVHHVLTAWRPDWIGSDQTRYFEIEGKNLLIKTAPVKGTQTGRDVVSILAFEKVK
jgi:hypothetical protein